MTDKQIKGLAGIKGIEVGGVAAMPLAGMLMSTWGAEIIHVEPPGRGDIQRSFAGDVGRDGKPQFNYLWEHANRNKRSIAVDIRTEAGRGILYKLIAPADVFLNNLRPYEQENYGLTCEDLSMLNPGLIYANLTGYGQQGPMKNVGGYDSVAFWARSGVMHLSHEEDQPPNVSRPAYGDATTAMHLLAGIMAALFMRERTGKGQEVSVSLFNAGLWSLGFDLSTALAIGREPKPFSRQDAYNPLRNHYPTRDNRWIMLGMTDSQRYWPELCEVTGAGALAEDPRFATAEARSRHRAELVTLLDEIFGSRRYDEWLKILLPTKLIWAPVMSPLEVTREEQAYAIDAFVDFDHPDYGSVQMIGNPIKLSNTPAKVRAKAPALGEQTDEIMHELGYSDGDIADLRRSGAIE